MIGGCQSLIYTGSNYTITFHNWWSIVNSGLYWSDYQTGKTVLLETTHFVYYVYFFSSTALPVTISTCSYLRHAYIVCDSEHHDGMIHSIQQQS